jgi:CRP/FNR family transcriptional regulator, cyclic AMP receptor protein
MSSSNGSCFIENCQACKNRDNRAFCSLSPEALRALDEISYSVAYPEHAVIFTADSPCNGVFMLCAGRAKLSTASRDDKKVMLQVASAGEILGLSSVLAGSHYEVGAETLSPAVLRLMKRDDFLEFLHKFPETSFRLLEALGQEYTVALQSLRSLAWFPTATARVAQLLLHICEEDNGGNRQAKVKMLLTQEQIAQMTATSRETVTRLLGQLRRQRIIAIRGSDLVIRNRAALEQMAC